jgi:transcriptional regulator with XRE-family HTH domain
MEARQILCAADEVLTAVRRRQEELGLSNESLEHISGLASGTANKYLGPSREKNPTVATLYLLLQAMGVGLVLVEDPDAIRRMSRRWAKRRESTVRPPDKVARSAIRRARSVVLSEAARKAALARWAGTSKKERLAVGAMLAEARAKSCAGTCETR